MTDDNQNGAEETVNYTMPQGVGLSVRGIAEEHRAYAERLAKKVHSLLHVISGTIDLSALDGVTIAVDYNQALGDLDRGYETSHVLTPTSDVAIGVAMTPRVKRDGVLKSHIVFNAAYLEPVLDENGEERDELDDDFWVALHLLAHESAHVEVTERFNRRFPGWLLEPVARDLLESVRWQTILACWEEYAVCRICRDIGHDPTQGYADTLVEVLRTAHQSCVASITAYRTHGNVEAVVCEVYGYLDDLLKYAAYFLGALHGTQRALEDFPVLMNAVNDSWFEPYFERLIHNLSDLDAAYGEWGGRDDFEAIGDIVEAMAEEKGIICTKQSDGHLYFDIPYRTETMPISA